MAKVQQGDTVRIYYTGRFEDGTVFDSSQEGEPLEFVAGGQEVIAGVSQGVLDMEEGQKKQLVLPPEDAYGPRSTDLEHWVAVSDLPDGVEVGDQLRAVQDNEEMILLVREMTHDRALLDGNHPLAGQTLVFDVEVISVEPTT